MSLWLLIGRIRANWRLRSTGKRIRHLRVAPNDVRSAMERGGVEAWFAADTANLHSMLAAGYEDLVTDDVRSLTGTSP
jgi:hypothetical protein